MSETATQYCEAIVRVCRSGSLVTNTLRRAGFPYAGSRARLTKQPKSLAQLFVLAFTALFAGQLGAQPVAFADDFSIDSLRYSLTESGPVDEPVPLQFNDNQLTLRATSSAASDQSTQLNIWGKTEVIDTIVSFDNDSTMGVGSQIEARLTGIFYNDTMDGGFDQRDGDVTVRYHLRLRDNGDSDAFYCFFRENSDFSLSPLLIVGTDHCGVFNVALARNVDYRMRIEFDRVNASFLMSLDDAVQEVQVGTSVFQPVRKRADLRVTANAGTSTAVVNVKNVTTDQFIDNFVSEPIVGRYQLDDLQDFGKEAVFELGTVRLMTESTDDSQTTTSLVINGETDFIDATVQLSSDSTAGLDGSARVQLDGIFYNDSENGGDGLGNEGDVIAQLSLRLLPDGTTDNLFCLIRSNDAGFGDTSPVITAGFNGCSSIPGAVDLDTNYTLAIERDLVTPSMIFRIDNREIRVTPDTELLDPSQHGKAIRSGVAGAPGRSVVLLDQLRTSSTATPTDTPDPEEIPDPEEMPDNGENPVVVIDVPTPVEGPMNPVEVDPSESSGGDSGDSGSGCSVGNVSAGSRDPMLLMLMIAGLIGGLRRRRKLVRAPI